MLIDDVTIRLEAGNGGNGAVAFNKTRLNLGPVGGDGGRGGNIYFEGVSNIDALQFYASKNEVKAKPGGHGRGQSIDGPAGEDLILKVPVGTIIRNMESGFEKHITKVGQRVLAAGGGKGGRGNYKFRSSTNTTPKEAEEGTLGDIVDYQLELRLIADVGLIGLPNVGKSSLLNELTNAKSKVANYQFTTLEPHLGAYYGLVLADIPGLIEGASDGKGLGIKFLRHIARTQVLFHFVSAESEDPVADYKTVRAELAAYSEELAEKKEYVFLSKSDAVTEAELKTKLAALKKKKITAIPLSLIDPESLEFVKGILNDLQAQKRHIEEKEAAELAQAEALAKQALEDEDDAVAW
ncbi:MAG: GTPase ObgE [Candidatus Pacebacteria bacterium]|nr:GTPase ObgE [Candidatus Paceibacterota bacterium]